MNLAALSLDDLYLIRDGLNIQLRATKTIDEARKIGSLLQKVDDLLAQAN